LLNLDVWNQTGEQIGEVEDMVLDLEDTVVSYVVIETGGFLDIGDKTLLVPWNMLELQTPVSGGTENAFVLTADPELLNNVPDIDLPSVLPGVGQPADDWDAEIRNFWEGGVMPSATQPGSEPTNATPAADGTAVPETTATTTGAGAGTVTGQDKLQGVMLASDILGAAIMIGQGQAQGQGTGQATAAVTAAVTAASSPAATAPAATANTGAGTGNQGSTAATIEDIIVDPDAGDILFLVLSTLFDDGERWIPIPLSTLRWDMTNETFLFIPNINALQNAPFFLPDEFPDTSAEDWDAEFNDYWQNNGGSGTGANPTATP
jgi:sporulation protein YlmC with PRC-barrel domain